MLSFRFKTTLLIDDDEVDTMVHAKLIKNIALSEQIIIKHSAKDALEFLNSRIASCQTLPEIIFLDINMPLMNGFEFLEELAKLPSFIWEKAKIIMLSSTIDREEIAKIKSNPYVSKFICKPLTPQALLQFL